MRHRVAIAANRVAAVGWLSSRQKDESDSLTERTIIIGGGLAGVATLFELVSRGRPAALIETRDDIALETSFANGGMATASQSEPWNHPGVARDLTASLFGGDGSIGIRMGALPSMIGWGLGFLRNATPARHREAALRNFFLARHSVERTREVTQSHKLDYDHDQNGSIKLFASKSSMEQTLLLADLLRPHGMKCEVLDRDGVLEREPSLSAAESAFSYGVYYPDDGAGDARGFTKSLASVCERLGGDILCATHIDEILTEQSCVMGVRAGATTLRAKNVVVASGNASASLLKPLGLRLPIRPAKGYSVTVDVTGWNDRPTMPVIDDLRHAAVSPFGDRIRLVGTAEFAGWDRTVDERRIQSLYSMFHDLFPHVDRIHDRTDATRWVGFRPMSVDGTPFIGAADVEGLWVNAGHGHLGWTMAMGSASMLVDLMMGQAPAIDPFPYRPNR